MWSEEVIPVIRVLINDYSSPVTYSDSRIIDTALIAAQLLLTEVTFSNSYSITLSSCTITPDPTLDDSFINLVSMKAACIILSGEAKTDASNSVKVIDGPSTIDLSTKSKNTMEIAKRMQDIYENAKLQYVAGNAIGGKAIITPYTYEGAL